MSFSLIASQDSSSWGGEMFPEEVGPNKLMKWAAAEAALKELQKRGPLPEKVREALKESDD